MSTPSSSILQSSRREALFVVAVWVASCVYTLGYAALFAYRPVDRPELLFGMPSWVVWGIVAPWLVVLGVTVWYSLWAMKDEDLGPEAGSELGAARNDAAEGAGG